MKAMTVFSCALILTAFGVGVVRADGPSAPSGPAALPAGSPMPAGGPVLPPTPTAAPSDALPPPGPGSHSGLSSWILYERPDCCGPIGGDGPINTELYVRVGPSVPVEGSVFGHVLSTGWDIQGGGRSVFFNKTLDADWAIDLSVSNIYNHGQRTDFLIPLYGLFVPATGAFPPVTVRDLNRTFVNAGIGRDWYILGPANACGCKWVWGVDAGGRYGTAKLDLNDFAFVPGVGAVQHPYGHLTDVIGGVYVAVHSEIEHSCGCCTFSYGFRAEWDYTWTDIIPPNDGDVEDVNLLVTFGVRF